MTVLVVVQFPWHTSLSFLKDPSSAESLYRLLGVRTSMWLLCLHLPVKVILLPQAVHWPSSCLVVVGQER